MKNLIVATLLLVSTSVRADSVDQALVHILGVAFQTGCLKYGFQSASKVDKNEVMKFCETQTKEYREELSKPEAAAKVKVDYGNGESTEISW